MGLKMFQVEDLIYNCPVEALDNILGKKWGTTIRFINLTGDCH